MSDTQNVDDRRLEPSSAASPGWWVMAARELTDLWVGGRALLLLILFSVLLGILSFLLATDVELSLIPPKEMTFLTLQATIAVGLFMGLVLGADSISGERDRETLEGLLLTPTSRRQIVAGKYLAAVSPWPAALAVASPHLALLSPDGELVRQALLWGALLGSLLVGAFTGLGMLVSVWSSSNKTSYSLSLVISLLCFLPTQLPASAQAGAVGSFIQGANPLAAANHFLGKVLVSHRSLDEMRGWLLAPVLCTALVLGLLFWYAGPRLRLEGGIASMALPYWRRAGGLSLTACLMVSLGAPPAMALPPAASLEAARPLRISLDADSKVAKTGDVFEFHTLLTNHGSEGWSELVVAMNIVNLKDGDPVDPEDWSPQRTQFVKHLGPGQSVNQTWTIRAILKGDYLVYLVVISRPQGRDVTSQPLASSGLHLTVTPFVTLNPGGVLPLAIGMPASLTLVMAFLRRLRLRNRSQR